MAKAKKKETLKDVVEKMWPKTKKELEKGMENAKKMLIKGEEYLREVSEKGIKQTTKLSLSIKKEKLYYDLGKAVASTSLCKAAENRKIGKLMKAVKDLEKQIKKIK